MSVKRYFQGEMERQAKELDGQIGKIQDFHTQGSAMVQKLDGILTNANPKEFFSFLLEWNPKIGAFI